MRKAVFPVLRFLALAAAGCGSSGGSCSVSTFTCATVLPASMLMSLQPMETGYMETGKLPCDWTLPSSSSGVFQVFCGDAKLFDQQVMTAMTSFPSATIVATDTIGMKSTEITLGPPMQSGSFAEIAALTTNRKYVFDVSLQNAASDIT